MHQVVPKLEPAIITVRNEVAKVMFLQAFVCSQGGGWGCLPQCMLGYHTPQSRHPPGSRYPPGADPPTGADTPQLGADTPLPEIRPLLRTVRILLECILVCNMLLTHTHTNATICFSEKESFSYTFISNTVCGTSVLHIVLNESNCRLKFIETCGWGILAVDSKNIHTYWQSKDSGQII